MKKKKTQNKTSKNVKKKTPKVESSVNSASTPSEKNNGVEVKPKQDKPVAPVAPSVRIETETFSNPDSMLVKIGKFIKNLFGKK